MPEVAEVLELPVAEILDIVKVSPDLGALTVLRKAERDGENRGGVVGDIERRMADLMEAGTAAPAAPKPESDDGMADLMATPESATTTENIRQAANAGPDAIERGEIEHTATPIVILYKLSSRGWEPREIPAANIRQVLEGGYKARCGDCGKKGCGVAGRDEFGRLIRDPNNCTGRDPTLYAQCPACGRKVYDPGKGELRDVSKDDDDPNRIVLDRYDDTSASDRIGAMLDEHMAVAHRTEARAHGLAVRSPSDPQVLAPTAGAAPATQLAPDARGAT